MNYWTTTSIISAMMLFSAYGFITDSEMKAEQVHLGFPDYFRAELAILKIVGALVLILPTIPEKLKSFSYFGFGLTFISAFDAHTVHNDTISAILTPIIFLGVLLTSYFFYYKVRS